MKSQQEPPDMLKQMADSMNLSVPEFTKMMKDEHGLVPPDEPDEDEDYYSPPERKMSVVALTPDVARKEADRCRKLLLDPDLSRYDSEEIANHIAQCVSAYGEVEQRIAELKLPESNKTEAQAKASCTEHNALIQVRQDKEMTTHQSDSVNSMASTLGLMNRGKLAGQNIDLIAYKESLEKRMDELIASGTAREKCIAQLVIMAQESAQNLIVEASVAQTSEARAMVMKSAMKCLEEAGKQVDRLDAMATPKTGRIVDHIEDKQLPNKTKKLKGKK
jgi:hypothetical protein